MGKWKFEEGDFLFYIENGDNLLDVSWTNGVNRIGVWELRDSNLNVALLKLFGADNKIFKIDELGTNVLAYTINKRKYLAIKVFS